MGPPFPQCHARPLKSTLSLLIISAGALLKVSSGDLSQQTKLRIDCGSSSASTISTTVGQYSFLPDTQYVTSGTPGSIPNAEQLGLNSVEASLRFFPADATSCHVIPVVPGRHLIRLGFAYYNYDGLNKPPRFRVLVQDTVAETVDMSRVSAQMESGAYYTDYIAFAMSGNISLCLRPQLSLTSPNFVSPPLINSLEILPIDTNAYDASRTGKAVVLSTFLRLNAGGSSVGPEPQDPGFRTWEGETDTRGQYKALTTDQRITDTGGAPDYLPQAIFQTCREALAEAKPANATGFAMTLVPVHPSNSWYLRYYLAEINPDVMQGQRLFHLVLGSGSATSIVGDESKPMDVVSKAGGIFSGLVVPVFFNFSERLGSYGEDVEIGVRTAQGSERQATLCGVELYEIIPQGWDGEGEGAIITSSSSTRGPSAGEIAAVVIGTVGAAAILAAFAIILIRRRAANAFVPIVDADMQGSPIHVP